ncbi:uncharacterized protein TNIN_478951 [Trichonephila inaurata madagascariensis]|uniref:DUF7041 domain-containing protein n=1 Tax=Trichonephila inaurata madagascariensis TaxID=2747483 RepID=A0A8X6XB88_9ARAC|nr:uncharacterized protein TNIN_478951 [Trichonephila inaurata madagascariensis]
MIEAEKLEASGISIKIPPFWFDKPEICFYQVEVQIKICQITSEETMFSHLVAQLEPRVLEDIWDIVKDPNVYSCAASMSREMNLSCRRCDRLKPAYLLAVDNQNEQTSGQKGETSNFPLPDEQRTTSCG